MDKIIPCERNIDTAYAEVQYSDAHCFLKCDIVKNNAHYETFPDNLRVYK